MVPTQEDPCNFLFYEGLSQERASFLIPVFLFLGGYSHQRVTPHLHFLICAHFSRVRRGNACETPKVLFFKILCPPGRNVARGNACKIPKVPFFKNFCPPGRNAARGNACKIHGQYMDNPSIGVNLGLIWNWFGIDLGSIWDRFGVDLGSIWGRFGGRFGVDLAFERPFERKTSDMRFVL